MKYLKNMGKHAIFALILTTLIIPHSVFAWGNISVGEASTTSTAMISDDTGGFWALWSREGSGVGGNMQLYGQHMDEQGDPTLFLENDLIIDADGDQTNPTALSFNAVSRGNQGLLLAWQDERNGNKDIYAQSLTMDGEKRWAEDYAIVNAEGGQSNPQIIASSSLEEVVVWQDERNGNKDIYAQELWGKFSPSGGRGWDENGVVVVESEGDQVLQDVVSDGRGNTYVSFIDEERNMLKVQKLNRDGEMQFPTLGAFVTTSTDAIFSSAMLHDGKDVFVAWEHGTLNSVSVQKLNTSGIRLWGSSGSRVTSVTDSTQQYPDILSDGSNGVYVVWEDNRPVGNVNLYFQHLDLNGDRMLDADGVLMTDDNDSYDHSVELHATRNENILLTYAKGKETRVAHTLRRQEVDPTDGSILTPEDRRGAIPDGSEYPATLVRYISDIGTGLHYTYVNYSGGLGDLRSSQIHPSGYERVIDYTAPVTTAEPVGGIYGSAQNVALTPNEDATTYYTTDGSVPTTNSSEYSGPVTVTSDNPVLKFFSVDTYGNTESVKTETYTLGSNRIVTTPGPGRQTQIKTFDTGGSAVSPSTITPYAAFSGGANVAVGDVNGDGYDEIVVAPRAGGGSHVRVYSKDGTWLGDIWPFHADSRTGIQVAVGNVDNDVAEEIILVPEAQDRAHVKVYNFDAGRTIVAEWDAYGSVESGGSVAVGDVDLDGIGEVIVGAGSGGGPHIRVFEGNGTLKPIAFFAYHTDYRGGIDVAAADVDGDGKAEIATVPREGVARVKIYRYNTSQTILGEWKAYDDFAVGGRLDMVDLDHDNEAEIVTGVFSGGPQVRAFESNGTALSTDFFAFEKSFRGGVDVSVGSF